jgi:hypothetical protein
MNQLAHPGVRVLCTHEVLTRAGISEQLMRRHFDYFVGSAGVAKAGDPPGLTRVRYPHWAQGMGHFAQLRAFEVLHSSSEDRRRSATFIAGNPNGGRRLKLIDDIRRTTKLNVLCAGKVGNNTARIGGGAPGKRNYIKRHLFNICPENTSYPGYVTEKLLEACVMGCIPIYWGHPTMEPGIINPDRVIRCESETRLGAKAATQIRTLMRDPVALRRFFDQPVFLPTAHEKMAELDRRLDNAILKMIT